MKFKIKELQLIFRTSDDKCFIYCLGRALDPTPEKKNLERVSTHLKTVCESLGLNNIKHPLMNKIYPRLKVNSIYRLIYSVIQEQIFILSA